MPKGELFDGPRSVASGGEGVGAWLTLQSAEADVASSAAAAVPEEVTTKITKKQLKAFLEISSYGDDRAEAWSGLDPEVRRHPAFLSGLLDDDYKAPEYIAVDAGDLEAMTTLLSDPKTVIELGGQASYFAKYIPEATLADPDVRAMLLQKIGKGASFERTPDVLRADPEFIVAALNSSFRAHKEIPDGAWSDPKVVEVVRAAAVDHLKDGGRISDFPDRLFESPAFVETVVTTRPTAWFDLDEAQQEATESLLTAPDVIDETAAAFAKRFERMSYSGQDEETWRAAPEAIRYHPTYLLETIPERDAVLEWAKLTPEQVDSLLPEALEKFFGRRVGELVGYMSPEAADRKDVRDTVVKGLADGKLSLSSLPEDYRRRPQMIRAAMAYGVNPVLEHVDLDAVSPTLLSEIENAIVANAKDRNRPPTWSDLPEKTQTETLARRLFAKFPDVVEQLPEAMLAKLDDLYDDPKRFAAALETYTKKYNDAWSDSREEVWEAMPRPVRESPELIRNLLQYGTSVIDLAEDEMCKGLINDALTDPEFLTHEKTSLRRLGKHIPEAMFERDDVKAACAKEIAGDHNCYSDFPEVVRNDPNCIEAGLEASDYNIKHVPEQAPDSPGYNAYRSGWLEYARRNNWESVPQPFHEDADFINELLIRRPALVEDMSDAERALGESALSSSDLVERVGKDIVDIIEFIPEHRYGDDDVKAAVHAAIDNAAWQYRKLPQVLKQHTDITTKALNDDIRLAQYVELEGASEALVSAVEAVCVESLASSTYNWGSFPDALTSRPDFLQDSLRKHPRLIDRFDDAALELAKPVLEDPEFLKASSEHIFTILEHLPESVLSSPVLESVLLERVESNPDYYDSLPEALQSHPRAVLAEVKEHGRVTSDVPRDALTDEVVEQILALSPKHMSGIEPKDISEEAYKTVLKAVLETIGAESKLDDIPPLLQDDLSVKRRLLTRAGIDSFSGWRMREKLHDPELWAKASKKNATKYITEYPDHAEVLPAARLADLKIALAGLKACDDSDDRRAFVAKLDQAVLADPEFVDPLLAVEPSMFPKIAADLRKDLARAKTAIAASPANIEHAPLSAEELKAVLGDIEIEPPRSNGGPWDDEYRLAYTDIENLESPDLILRRLQRKPEASRDLPARFAADPSLFEQALRSEPKSVANWPWSQLSEEGQTKCRALLERAVVEDPTFFEHLPPALRGDAELLEAVLPKWPEAITHATGATQSDDALWEQAARLDIRVIKALGDHSSRAKRIAERTGHEAIRQIRAGLIAPNDVTKGYYQGPNNVEIVSELVRQWGGDAIQMYADWMRHYPVQTAVRDACLKDPVRLAHGLKKLPSGMTHALAALPREPDGTVNDAAFIFACELVKREPDLFGSLPHELQNLAAVESIAIAAKPPWDVFKHVYSDEQRIRVLHRRPGAIEQLQGASRSDVLVKTAVAMQGDLLRHGSQSQRDNKDLVLAAVKSDGAALQYASERMRKDPEVVDAAAATSKEALKHSLLSGAEARTAALISTRNFGLEESAKGRLVDADFVIALAEFLCDRRRPEACVGLSSSKYFFEHHLEDPEFCARLFQYAPSFFTSMPEERRTPEMRFAYALRTGGDYRALADSGTLRLDEMQQLARRHPSKFVSAFTRGKSADDLQGDLRKAVLTAIAEDHAVARDLPADAWSDSQLIADAVTASPMLYRWMAPARQKWLGALQPDAVKRGEDFMERLDACNIDLGRFSGRSGLLTEIVENRFYSGTDDPRPRAIVVFPRDDYNDAFNTPPIDELRKKYRLMYYEAGDVPELAQGLAAASRGGNVGAVIIGGHGSPQSLQLGKSVDRPDAPTHLRPENAKLLAQALPPARMNPGCRVSLESCKSGRGGLFTRNLAVTLGDVWPVAWVQAPQNNSSGGDKTRMSADGTFEGMDYRDAKTDDHVPFTLVPPRVASARRVRPRRGVRPLR